MGKGGKESGVYGFLFWQGVCKVRARFLRGDGCCNLGFTTQSGKSQCSALVSEFPAEHHPLHKTLLKIRPIGVKI